MPDHLDVILSELKRHSRVDLSGYKSDTLKERLKQRLNGFGYTKPQEYLFHLRNDPTEFKHLLEALTVQVSEFFRNPLVWEVMARRILPALLEARKRKGQTELRIWTAGCSSGEEAYSLAILLNEVLGDDIESWQPYVFATDISKNALAEARKGQYGEQRLQSAKLGIVKRYFEASGDCYAVKNRARDMVHFSWHDLAAASQRFPPESIYGGFDLVLCRNVLIYFTTSLQKLVLQKLAKSIRAGGCLVLGESESIGNPGGLDLQVLDPVCCIYGKTEPI